MSLSLLEGYLYKNKKFRTTGWKKRWFVLRQSGSNGHYALEYYQDISKKKLKGTIDLDPCEVVCNACMSESPPKSLMKNNYRYVFDVKTPDKHYYLVASSQEEMDRWVNNICRVCGLHQEGSDEETEPSPPDASEQIRSVSRVFDTQPKEISPPLTSPRSQPAQNQFQTPSTHSINSPPVKVTTKEDSPYILLKNCYAKMRHSDEKFSGIASESTRNGEQLRRQLSIPEEAAPPPPPTQVSSDITRPPPESPSSTDNLYKLPVKIELYDSSKRNQWSSNVKSPKTLERLFTMTNRSISVNQNSIPMSPSCDSLRPRYEFQKSQSVEDKNELSPEMYDQVPRLSPRPVDPTSPRVITDRKTSLPTDALTGQTYDRIPTVRTPKGAFSEFSTLPHRRTLDTLDAAANGAIYNRPPQRSRLISTGDLGAGMSALALHDQYDSPPSSKAGQRISPKPPPIDRNRKPLETSEFSNRIGKTEMKLSDGILANRFLPNGFSQENVPSSPRTRSDNKAAAQAKEPGVIHYTDLTFSNPSSDSKPQRTNNVPSNFSRTLPHPPKKPLGAPSGIEYKDIDPVKTLALRETKKELESSPQRSGRP